MCLLSGGMTIPQVHWLKFINRVSSFDLLQTNWVVPGWDRRLALNQKRTDSSKVNRAVLMCLWMWQPSRLNPSALLHCETYLESPSGLKLSSMLGCHRTALCHRLTGWIGSPEGKPCLSPRCLIQFHKSQRASKLSRQYSKYVSLIRLQQQWKRWFSALGSSVMRCLSNSNHNPACD